MLMVLRTVRCLAGGAVAGGFMVCSWCEKV